MKKRIAIVGFLFVCLFLSACGGTEQSTTAGETSWADLDFSQETEILYATQFDAASTQDGYTKLTVADGETYLLVPEGKEVPGDVPAEVTVIRQLLENIYLAATSAMDLFRGLDAIDKVTGSYDDYCRRVQQVVQSMCIEDNNQKLVEQLKQALGLS